MLLVIRIFVHCSRIASLMFIMTRNIISWGIVFVVVVVVIHRMTILISVVALKTLLSRVVGMMKRRCMRM